MDTDGRIFPFPAPGLCFILTPISHKPPTMNAPTRILIVTDSAVLPFGMAETTRLIFSTLLDNYPQQYELHQVGLFHCYAVTQPRWPIYPTQTSKEPDGQLRFAPEDRYGQKTFFKVAAKLQPDIVFAFGEPQRVAYLCAPPNARRHRLVIYTNLDGLPLPPGYAAALRHADRVFTKSEFARNVLASALPDLPAEKLGYLYAPADTQRFSPISPEARVELRKDLLPDWMPQDACLLGWVGRNQWRKQVWLLYKVIHYLRTGAYLICQRCGKVSLFDWDPSRQVHLQTASEALESRPGYDYQTCGHCGAREVNRAEPMSDAYLWLHMAEDPEQDWPAAWLEQQFGLQRGRDLYYTEGYEHKAALVPTDMPTLYNLWDCLLYLTGGEGFGLPAWEAMASGLPVIYTNYSSHAEFLGRANGGLPVGGVLQPERGTCIWRMIADVPQVIEAVRKLYFDRELEPTLGRNGRAFTERFRPEIQVDRWHRILQELRAV